MFSALFLIVHFYRLCGMNILNVNNCEVLPWVISMFFFLPVHPCLPLSFLARHVLYAGHLPVAAGGHRHSRYPSDSAADAYTEGFQHPDLGPVLLLLHSSNWVRPAPWETEPSAVVWLRPGDWQRVKDTWRDTKTNGIANLSQCHRNERLWSGVAE